MASSPWSVSHQVLQKWDYYPVLHWTHYSVNQPEVSWGAGSNRLQKYFLSKQPASTNSPPTSRHLQAAKAGIWNSWFTHWTKAVFIITSKLQYILCSTALNGDFTSHHRWIYKWRKTGRPIKTRREKVSSADQNCSQKSEIIHKLFWENMFPNSPARQLGKRLKVEVGEISVVTDLVLPLSKISQSGDKPPEEELEGGSPHWCSGVIEFSQFQHFQVFWWLWQLLAACADHLAIVFSQVTVVASEVATVPDFAAINTPALESAVGRKMAQKDQLVPDKLPGD